MDTEVKVEVPRSMTKRGKPFMLLGMVAGLVSATSAGAFFFGLFSQDEVQIFPEQSLDILLDGSLQNQDWVARVTEVQNGTFHTQALLYVLYKYATIGGKIVWQTTGLVADIRDSSGNFTFVDVYQSFGLVQEGDFFLLRNPEISDEHNFGLELRWLEDNRLVGCTCRLM